MLGGDSLLLPDEMLTGSVSQLQAILSWQHWLLQWHALQTFRAQLWHPSACRGLPSAGMAFPIYLFCTETYTIAAARGASVLPMVYAP